MVETIRYLIFSASFNVLANFRLRAAGFKGSGFRVGTDRYIELLNL